MPYGSITCTPHLKLDADNPWVTKESSVHGKEEVHYWFNPGKAHTLLQAAETIEVWLTRQHIQHVQNLNVKTTEYHLTINTMEIRGVPYDRQTMAGTYANEHLRSEEPITLHVQSTGGVVKITSLCCTIL